MTEVMTSIAIIGAGLSGLVVARELSLRHDVSVFEKARGVGGRIATSYTGEFEFDHGAQFLTARSDAFKDYLRPRIENGAVANWAGRFAELEGNRLITTRYWGDTLPHYVGTPRMNALGKYPARELNVRLRTCVSRLEREKQQWLLRGTHRWRWFRKSSEIRRLLANGGLPDVDSFGVAANPLRRSLRLTGTLAVNYRLFSVRTSR